MTRSDIMDHEFSTQDIKKNKAVAVWGYVVFFLPLILRNESKLCRFCANQGLLIMIVQLLIAILFNILGGIPLLGWLLAIVGKLIGLALLVGSLLLTAQASTNERFIELPYIGFIRLIPEE